MEMRASEERVAAVRAFNRFYTEVIGVLRDGLLDTPYSLTEARILYELADGGSAEVAELRRALGLDAGYLSRILARFSTHGLIVRERSEADGRRQVIRLTNAGGTAFKLLDDRSARQVAGLLAPLDETDQRRLVGAMEAIRKVLARAPRPAAFVLRPAGAGDLGWVVHRHGIRYAEDYGWDETFEAMVARIVADYAQSRDPKRENAWIAEVDGEPVGSVFCVREDERLARLRLLLVEPSARGLGIGARLVDECLRFARQVGYERITLWTNDVLTAARRIYERAGFELVREEAYHGFGKDLVGQDWERRLDRPLRAGGQRRTGG